MLGNYIRNSDWVILIYFGCRYKTERKLAYKVTFLKNDRANWTVGQVIEIYLAAILS